MHSQAERGCERITQPELLRPRGRSWELEDRYNHYWEYLSNGTQGLEEAVGRRSILGVFESRKELALSLERFRA
jgi:hypothetical protein